MPCPVSWANLFAEHILPEPGRLLYDRNSKVCFFRVCKLFFKKTSAKCVLVTLSLLSSLDNRTKKKTRAMKTVKLSTIEKQIRDGKVECMTDLRIGYVEIRNCITDKRYFVNVIK